MSTATRYFIYSSILAIFLSVPTWLPLFGIELEAFKSALVTTFQSLLPFILPSTGFATGWIAHKKTGENERLEADMRKREESERLDREEAENEARRKQARESHIVESFRHGNPLAKRYIIEMYKDGSAEMREEDFRTLGLCDWADYETFESGDWRDTHTYVKANLKDDVREVIDRYKLIK